MCCRVNTIAGGVVAVNTFVVKRVYGIDGVTVYINHVEGDFFGGL